MNDFTWRELMIIGEVLARIPEKDSELEALQFKVNCLIRKSYEDMLSGLK